MTHTHKTSLIIAVAIGLIVMASRFHPVAQDLAYHHFADHRTQFGIPHFNDVASNGLFLAFGLMGIRQVTWRISELVFTMDGERQLWLVFFTGAACVGLGSAYYHLDPNNTTLVWDRLPMTIVFMSFFSLIIMERIHPRTGLMLFPILLLAGAGSVFYWDYTEALGQGDLRPYALVQFLPLLLIPLKLWLFPPRYSGLNHLGHTVGWYVLAKLLEYFDATFFRLFHQTVSGHTLKHLAAAMAVYSMLNYVRNRKAID
jgi:hypothetical protein